MLTRSPWILRLTRGTQRGMRMLLRERPWLTTLLLFTCVCTLLQLLVLGVGASRTGTDLLSRAASVRLEIVPGVSQNTIQSFFLAVGEQSGVEDAQYVTREQAYQQQRQTNPDLIAFLDRYKLENPFPDAVIVQLTSAEGYDQFKRFVLQDQWKSVVRPESLPDFTGGEERARDLLHLTDIVRMATGVFLTVSLLLLIAVLMQSVVAALQAHRKDIDLLTALGSDSLTIALPFFIELSVLLLLGVLAATVLCAVLVQGIAISLPGWGEQEVLVAFAMSFTRFLHASWLPVLLVEVLCVPVLAGTVLMARLHRSLR